MPSTKHKIWQERLITLLLVAIVAFMGAKLSTYNTAGSIDGDEKLVGTDDPSGTPTTANFVIDDIVNYTQTGYLPSIDEDTLSSDSAAHVPTQQSVKAYVDASDGNANTNDAKHFLMAFVLRRGIEDYRTANGAYPSGTSAQIWTALQPYVTASNGGYLWQRVTLGTKDSTAFYIDGDATPTPQPANSSGWVYSPSSGKFLINSTEEPPNDPGHQYDEYVFSPNADTALAANVVPRSTGSALAAGVITDDGSTATITGSLVTRNGNPQYYSPVETDRRWTYNLLDPDLAKIYFYDESGGTFHDFRIGGDNTDSTGLTVGANGQVDIPGDIGLGGAIQDADGDTKIQVEESADDDTIRFDAGGAEVAKFDASATAGQTRFLIYDVDNGTLERVTVGAADSGGSGYKVLRIPN